MNKQEINSKNPRTARKSTGKWLALMTLPLILSYLSGCAMVASGPTNAECSWAQPIMVSPQDHLTRGTKEQIVAHNLAGEKNCGWVPPQ